MKLKKFIKKYWTNETTNIFKNYKDALFGLLVLIVIPVLSIFFTINSSPPTFWNYTFPFWSISFAGLYDSYGRYDKKLPSNVKLITRVILHLIALLFATLSPFTNLRYMLFVSPCILLMCGLLVLLEIIKRLRMAIRIN